MSKAVDALKFAATIEQRLKTIEDRLTTLERQERDASDKAIRIITMLELMPGKLKSDIAVIKGEIELSLTRTLQS